MQALIILAVLIGLAAIGGVVAYMYYRKILREAKNYERGLKMVPLLIHLPPTSDDIEGGGRDARDVSEETISKAQVLYNIIASTATKGFKSKFYGQRHIAFEIIAAKGVVNYYTAVPVALVPVVEQAITSAYPSARLEEVEEHNIFSSVGKISGEISLANKGILFLDEFPEYTRSSLEALRQPLEDRIVTVARAQDTVTFPADFMLVATQNPCPCGYYMDPDHTCTCTPNQINQYAKKISGPLLDRIDLVVPVQKVEHKHLLPDINTENKPESSEISKRVLLARAAQSERFNSSSKVNSHMSNRDISNLAHLSPEAKTFLETAARKLALSARSYMKVIRVSRTIADLDNSPNITTGHMSEALQYRPR